MLDLPTEIINRIVNPTKGTDETFLDFFHRLFPVMCVNQKTMHLFHSKVYESLYLELDPEEDDPIVRQYAHMEKCKEATARVQHMYISGLINDDIEGAINHDLHAADLAAVLRLLPNIRALTIRHIDLLPPEAPTPPLLPVRPIPIPTRITELNLYWIRFSHPDSFDQLRFLTPNLVDLRASHILWVVPFPTRTLIHEDIGPNTAQLIDIFPDYPPMGFRFFQLTVSAWLGSLAFGANLTKLHLGSHDSMAVLPEVFDLWETLQFEAMPALETITFSINLRNLHNQLCSTLFAATVARTIIRSPQCLSTIYISLITEDLLGAYPDDPLTTEEWFLIRTACTIHGAIAAVIVSFIDDGPNFPDRLPVGYITPIEHGFSECELILLYVCTDLRTWSRKALRQ